MDKKKWFHYLFSTSCCAIRVSCLANILEKKWCLFLDGKGRHALNLWLYTFRVSHISHFVFHVFPTLSLRDFQWIFTLTNESHQKDITVTGKLWAWVKA